MVPSVKKRIQNYEYKIYKYLCIKRKEATTNYKLKKKTVKYQKHHRIKKIA